MPMPSTIFPSGPEEPSFLSREWQARSLAAGVSPASSRRAPPCPSTSQKTASAPPSPPATRPINAPIGYPESRSPPRRKDDREMDEPRRLRSGHRLELRQRRTQHRPRSEPVADRSGSRQAHSAHRRRTTTVQGRVLQPLQSRTVWPTAGRQLVIGLRADHLHRQHNPDWNRHATRDSVRAASGVLNAIMVNNKAIVHLIQTRRVPQVSLLRPGKARTQACNRTRAGCPILATFLSQGWETTNLTPQPGNPLPQRLNPPQSPPKRNPPSANSMGKHSIV